MRKQLLPYLLTVFMSMFGQNAFAYNFAVKNADGMTIYYSYNDTGLTVTNSNIYNGDSYGDDYSGDVVIPESVEYSGKIYKVTCIGNEAFFRCSSMTSISIPSSIKSISGDEVFYGCYRLTSVIISDLSSWCNVYFGNASANPLTYYARNLFLNNKKVTKLIIPDDVTNISSYAFSGCRDLTSVTIPNSVKEIGASAFKGCSSLTSVTIPNSVTSVGSNAFDGTPWFDNQPDGLVYVGKVAYKYKGEMPTYSRITIKDGTFEIASDAFFGCSGLTSVTIPNSVTSIGREAFSSCSGLTSITIPNSVAYIGDYAFSGCSGLTSVTIPNSVTSIGGDAFRGCSGLTSVTIPISVTSIGNEIFFGCSGLTSVTIPNSVTSIGREAFSSCSGLTSITIPNSVTSIGNYAFSGCSGLTSITIPNSVTSIDHNAFYNCSGLTSIIVGNGNEIYDSRNNCNAIIETSSNTLIVGCKNTVIPSSVTSIGSYAFYNCSGLTSVTIPNSVTSIGSSAFSGTAWYNNQPDGLVYAGKVAYKYKGEMPTNTNITIKDGTLGIAEYAFQNCSGLTSVTIPNSVTSIGERAFSGCSGLTSVTIPNSVTSIGGSAFEGCSGLTSVTIGNSVTSIGNYAFSYCSGLTSVTIPNSVTSIGSSAFSWCSGLTSVTIPNSVTSIGSSAFSGCSGLTSVTIPNSVTSIGGSAFSSCSGLTSVTIGNSVISIDNYAFAWCTDLTSVSIPNSVTSIGGYAFISCTGLTSVTIPNSVTSIGSHAFSDCSGLTSVTIGNSVISIDNYAFAWCTDLTSVTIPNSVTSIGERAFSGCKGLTTIVSEIEKPFEICSDNYRSTFSDDTYIVAELIVPYGTKTAYQNTEGWNKFTMITEVADKDEASFTIDGITYEGSKSAKTVVVKAVDTKQMSVEIPASVSYDGTTYQVTGIADDAFNGCSIGALIWNVEAALPNNAFSNASIGSNFLLYVKQASFAPSSIKNVIANGTASSIVLSDDGGQFYCPQSFTACSISYTHNYSMETGGNGKGWETIALPFDVQRIVHSTRGEIVPFAGYSSASNRKPFWLGNMSASGFKRASSIQANEPYIIAMPNNSKYNNDYNLAGDVTFSADNVQVAKTPTFSGLFLPAFGTVPQSSTVYALNVNNRHVKYSGNYDAGSRFIANLRDVRPFEAYMTGSSSTRGIIEISFDDGTTDMLDILLPTNESQKVSIHTLSGQQIIRTTQCDFDAVWQQLPKGVYIINGKKWIK